MAETDDRRERMREEAMKNMDVTADDYCVTNHLGQIVCRLCQTTHKTEANYYVHTQSKRHSTNLRRLKRAREEAEAAEEARRDSRLGADEPGSTNFDPNEARKRRGPSIGQPVYTFKKHMDYDEGTCSLRFDVLYPQLQEGTRPMHRIMGTYEQSKEAKDDRIMYLVFAGEPYETIAFRLPMQKLRKEALQASWDASARLYSLSLVLGGVDGGVLDP